MDINCDLGEGMAHDQKIMPYLDSCNIACGGHAGDRDTIRRTLRLAKKFHVKPGAHPSFVDRENFGRTEVSVAPELLRSQLVNQIGLIIEMAREENMELHHVKAHGALYNKAARSLETARLFIEVVQFFDLDLCIYIPFDSLIEKLAIEMEIPYMTEVFADRNYDDNFKLLPRSERDALIESPVEIKKRVERMLGEGTLVSLHGKKRIVNFDTLCVHGDHPKAVEIVKVLRDLKSSYIE
jgi:UPF0271 protein